MGAVNSGARSEGGRTLGVSHELFHGGDVLIEDKIVCKGDDLAERRRQLLQQADMILVLPGGPGTLDELWETAVCKILSLGGAQYKPLCVINIDNYFDGTIAQLKRASEENLLYGACEEYFHVEDEVAAALEWGLAEYHRLHALKSPSSLNTEAWAAAESGSSIAPKVFH
jgi:predicted Rossmann-fold nucleotide-binding protein